LLATSDNKVVEASGWTMPRVDFRLLAGSDLAMPTNPVARSGEPYAPADPVTASPPVPSPARNTAEGQAVEFAFAAVRLPAEHRALVRYELTVRQAVSIPF